MNSRCFSLRGRTRGTNVFNKMFQELCGNFFRSLQTWFLSRRRQTRESHFNVTDVEDVEDGLDCLGVLANKVLLKERQRHKKKRQPSKNEIWEKETSNIWNVAPAGRHVPAFPAQVTNILTKDEANMQKKNPKHFCMIKSREDRDMKISLLMTERFHFKNTHFE